MSAPAGASVDAAVVEAAYWTLSTYFPAAAASPGSIDRSLALAAIQAAPAAKTDGIAVGLAAASGIITLRTGDGRQTPIATTSPVEKKNPGPGVWRLTPPAFAAPQTPWLGSVQPFLLKSPGQFKTEPPVPLTSKAWVRAFDEVKAYGKSDSTVRTDEQTATAKFYTLNVIRQFNRAARDLAGARPPAPRLAPDGTAVRHGQHGGRRRPDVDPEPEVPLPVLAPSDRHRPDGGDHGRLRAGARIRRRKSGDRRADVPAVAAATDDAQPPRVPVSARNDHVRHS